MKFTYYKKANKQNRSTFMYITYWRSRLAPRRLSNQQLSILFDERARCRYLHFGEPCLWLNKCQWAQAPVRLSHEYPVVLTPSLFECWWANAWEWRRSRLGGTDRCRLGNKLQQKPQHCSMQTHIHSSAFSVAYIWRWGALHFSA